MEYERFTTLVAPHARTMAKVAIMWVGEADADDAAQEALLRAWRGWPTLREPEATRAWLLRITVNVCRSWRAGHFGTVQRTTESLGDTLRQAPTSAGELQAGADAHADALDLRRALATLSEDARTIVILRFYAGMDATEMSAVLDTPAATIRTRLRRALLHLRNVLGEREAAPYTSPMVKTMIVEAERSAN